MSTPCYVGKENPDKSITYIYVHHDGYLEGVGKELLNSYQDEEKINKLLELGDLSSLGDEPITDSSAWKNSSYSPRMCISYKDRGETDVDAVTVENLKALEKQLDAPLFTPVDYAYIFRKGKWYYCSTLRFPLEWFLLSNAITAITHAISSEKI